MFEIATVGKKKKIKLTNYLKNFGEIDFPYLNHVPLESYSEFLQAGVEPSQRKNQGLQEVFKEIFPVHDSSQNLVLDFIEYTLGLGRCKNCPGMNKIPQEECLYDECYYEEKECEIIHLDGKPYRIKMLAEDCKRKGLTYSLPLQIRVQLFNKQTGELKEQNIFICDLPIMTHRGTFIFNGAERVVVSQLQRSPGAFFSYDEDKKMYEAKIVPYRGAWLSFELDIMRDMIYARLNRKRKVPVTAFLRVLGFREDEKIAELFNHNHYILNTLKKDSITAEKKKKFSAMRKAIQDVFVKIRPGDQLHTEDRAIEEIEKLFFDPRSYDLDNVGRFKIDKKLSLKYKIRGKKTAETIYSGKTGEILAEPGEDIDGELAEKIDKSGVKSIKLRTADGRENTVYRDPDWETYSLVNERRSIENKLWGAVSTRTLYDDNGEIIIEAEEEIYQDTIERLLESSLQRVYYYLEGKEEVLKLSEYRGKRILLKDKEELYQYLNGRVLYENVVDPNTGIVLYEAGEELTFNKIDRLYEIGVHTLKLKKGRVLCKEDIISLLRYMLDLVNGVGEIDDIDHLGNRRVRRVGELLKNQFSTVLSKIKKEIRERMTINNDIESITPTQLINSRPIQAAVKDFFGTGQLSQFMDQTNPLSELTHKRRVSALGPGGLKKERAGFEVRDVHPTHFGRICPIETPEGQNAGLIGSLTVYARINKYGFIETPLMRVKDKKLRKDEIRSMDAHEEDGYVIASTDVTVENGYIVDEKVPVKFVRDESHEFSILESEKIDYIRVSPRQMISVATSLIPFLEHDDANRALMGTNMQRQAVPLITTEGPLVGSEMEYRTALDSGVVVVARESGTVRSIKGVRAKDGHLVYEIEIMTDPKPGRRVVTVKTSDKEFLRRGNRKVSYETIVWPETGEIIIEKGEAFSLNILKKVKRLGIPSISVYNAKIEVYRLEKFGKSNQDTCINQRPIVKVGDHVEKGEIIADGHCVDNGELALGKNLLVAFMSWEGYNYEDAILISERLVKDDVYTSIHIEEYSVEARDTKLGPEEITNDIPNISEDLLKNLDENGIIRVGAKVEPGDILVGKVTPKGVTELTAEDKLLRAIFGEKARETKDSSFRLPHGVGGVVVDVMVFDRKDKSEQLPHGVNKMVKVFIAQKRKIMAGDKMAGRHGNKGVISKVFPVENMPFIEDGTPVDIVLNPLGVPSRMNVGQVFETLFGFGAKQLGLPLSVELFSGSKKGMVEKFIVIGRIIRYGTIKIFNPKTGKQIGWLALEEHDKDKIRDIFFKAQDFFTAMAEIIVKFKGKLLTVGKRLPAYRFKSKIKVDQLAKALETGEIKDFVEEYKLLEKTKSFLEEHLSDKKQEYVKIPILKSPEDNSFEPQINEMIDVDLKEAKKTYFEASIPIPKEEKQLIDEILTAGVDIYYNENGKQIVYDGRTGERYHDEVVVGDIYMMKLYHLVEDKIHARATGPYSLVTQQPLGGKAQFGGQRLGEMEVWAIEAYGAAHTLQELLTIKSDDVEGRVEVYEAITKNERKIRPRVPESFKVLVNELRALCLKTTLHHGDEYKELSDFESDLSKERKELSQTVDDIFKS